MYKQKIIKPIVSTLVSVYVHSLVEKSLGNLKKLTNAELMDTVVISAC